MHRSIRLATEDAEGYIELIRDPNVAAAARCLLDEAG
jgi:hypothetical protein